MPKVQFESTKQDEISLYKIKHLAMLNGMDASKKGDFISLGLEWLMVFMEKLPKEQVSAILRIRQ